VESLSVSFDGFKAVDIPHFGIKHGELRVIIGPEWSWENYFLRPGQWKDTAVNG
jgi:ABC-type uncharacterized transport system ATPase subunit